VSFAAIPLYAASQRICIKFCFKLRNIDCKSTKYSEQLVVPMPWDRLLSSKSIQMGKHQLMTLSIHVVCPQVKQAKRWRNFSKSPTKNDVCKTVNKD